MNNWLTSSHATMVNWWDRNRLFIVEHFRGVYTPKSNLSEPYQSGLGSNLSLCQALKKEGFASIKVAARLKGE